MKATIRVFFLLLMFILSAEIYVTPAPAPQEDNTHVQELEAKIAVLESQLALYEKEMQSQQTDNEQLWGFIRSTVDYKDLTRIVEAEAGGESFEGKLHVAAVVMNRVGKFKDTVHDVIHQPKQFSPVADGRFQKVKVSNDSINAAEEIIKNGSITEALYFMNPRIASDKGRNWMKSLALVSVVGNHEFYK